MSFILLVTLTSYLSVLNGEKVLSGGCRQDDMVTITCNTILDDVPPGTLKFHLHIKTPGTLVLNSSTFTGENWSELQNLEFTEDQHTHLVFKDNCFNGLDALEELHIHVYYPEVFQNSFSGLDHVKTLDFTGCGRMTIQEYKMAINGSDILPGLQKVVLSNWNNYEGSYAFDDNLVEVLLPRNITEIDISMSQVSVLNITAVAGKFPYLNVVNGSHTLISDMHDTGVVPEDFKHLEVLDSSYVKFPYKAIPFLPANLVVRNVTTYISKYRHAELLSGLFTPQYVNYSGIVPHFTSFWFYNVTVIIDKELSLSTKTLICQQNNFKRLDIQLICDSFHLLSFKTLDFSDNGMEFLHPTILSCFQNLVNIDLSKNQLFKMVEENRTLFQNLFSGLEYLRSITMSANGLYRIPTKLFQNCESVEKVDLSNNRIKQVTFTLKDLKNLKVFNLQGNDIHILDSLSTSYLNSIPHGRDVNTSNITLILDSNPISCSVCEAKPFIQWLISTNLINTTSQKLKCLDENGKYNDINGNAVEIVQKICHRKTIIMSTSITAAVAFLLSVLFGVIIYKRYKQKQRIRNRETVIENLSRGEGQYQFAVFLSFSNLDEEFVNRHIHDQLNKNLQVMIDTERTLVCTGDQHFRPGFHIHDETFRLLDSAAVLIVVVTNNFLASNFCHSELNKAYDDGKPVVLMLIGEVDTNLMTPTLKALYQKNTRILWKDENGDYILKTSWENICTSVLDLMIP